MDERVKVRKNPRKITLPSGEVIQSAAEFAHLAESPDWDGKCCASKTRGGRCGQYAIRGAIVCRTHGGSAPQSREAARRRLFEQRVKSEVSELMTQYEDETGDEVIDPLETLIEMLKHAKLMARLLASLTVGSGVLAIEDSRGDLKSHPLAGQHEYWVERCARFAKLAIDSGVEERRVQIAESHAAAMVAAVQSSFDALDLTPEQAAKAPQVVAALLRAIAGE